jgi:predicted metal-binding membrane protein
MTAPTLGTRVRRDPAVVLWAAAGTCWVATVWLLLVGGDELGHHDVVVQSTLPWAQRIAAFLAVWLVMVGAMMLPTVVPLVRLFVPVTARAPRAGAARAAFLAAYLAVWTLFAGVALLGDLGVHALVDRWTWLAARPGLVLGATLLLAGAFQFSPLKNACLTACRNPVGFLWQHYRRGIGGGWRLGLRHGVSCLGCCWALMLVMFGTGVGSLAWMIGLTGVMVVEKTSARGARLVGPVGVALLVAGAVASASALVVPPEPHGGHGLGTGFVALAVAGVVLTVLLPRPLPPS